MFEGILATSWFCGESVAKTCLIRFLVVKMLNMFLIKNSGNIRKNGFPNVTLRKCFQKLLEFFPLSLQQIPRILFKMASQHKIHFLNKIPGIFVRSYSLQEKITRIFSRMMLACLFAFCLATVNHNAQLQIEPCIVFTQGKQAVQESSFPSCPEYQDKLLINHPILWPLRTCRQRMRQEWQWLDRGRKWSFWSGDLKEDIGSVRDVKVDVWLKSDDDDRKLDMMKIMMMMMIMIINVMIMMIW